MQLNLTDKQYPLAGSDSIYSAVLANRIFRRKYSFLSREELSALAYYLKVSHPIFETLYFYVKNLRNSQIKVLDLTSLLL